MVPVEHEKCDPDSKEALVSSGIFNCYLDEFGNKKLKISAVLREMYHYLDQAVNLNDMMDSLVTNITIKNVSADRAY